MSAAHRFSFHYERLLPNTIRATQSSVSYSVFSGLVGSPMPVGTAKRHSRSPRPILSHPIGGGRKAGLGKTRMYPLPLILVGIDDNLLSDVLIGLASSTAQVESEYATVGAAIEGLRHGKSERRLLVVRVGSECDVAGIRRLSSLLIGWPILALIPGDIADENFFQVNLRGSDAGCAVASGSRRLSFRARTTSGCSSAVASLTGTLLPSPARPEEVVQRQSQSTSQPRSPTSSTVRQSSPS